MYLADPIPTVCWEQFINCTILGPGTGRACPPIVDVCIWFKWIFSNYFKILLINYWNLDLKSWNGSNRMYFQNFVAFISFWDLNSITKKTNLNNWSAHRLVSQISNLEFQRSLIYSEIVFTKKYRSDSFKNLWHFN